MKWIKTIKRLVRESWIFCRFVGENFINDDCIYRASALAFTSLLAVVPLMTVGLAIFSSFPVFHELQQPMQDFIFENFVPSTGKVIQGYLQSFASQVSKLSVWGMVFLIGSALLVMYTIEQAMNKIWRVRHSRHGVSAFLLYWAILSLAPLFLGLSLAASSYLASIPFFKVHHAPSFLLSTVPYLFSLVGFTFLYLIVPNHRVKFWHGFAGAVFATLLFESAKAAFAFYLTSYNTYTLLYGAFATLPIFFIWIYWVWIIILLGAEISYAFSAGHQRRTGQPIGAFVQALLWLEALWQAQQENRGLTTQQLIHCNSLPFAVDVDEMLETLMRAGLIHITSEEEFRLSQDLSGLSVYALSQALPYRLPAPDDFQRLSPLAQKWQALFAQTQGELEKTLALPLEKLFNPLPLSNFRQP